MRTLLRAGAVALVASLALGSGAVRAQAGSPPNPAADQAPRIVDHGVEEAGLAAAVDPPEVNLVDLVLSYRNGMPREENTNRFRWNADSPAEVTEIIKAMRLANKGEHETRDTAARILATYGYNLDLVRDSVSHRNYLVMSEQTPCQRCWGLYILRYDSSSAAVNVAVEVPHPFSDESSEEIGIEAFRQLDAKMFAMAGAHRNSNTATRPGYPNSRVSDMARSYESLFHKVHTNFTTRAPNATHVLQVHGFEARPGYPQVVLSNGSAQPHTLLRSFADQLNRAGVTAGVYDGQQYPAFGATVNPQARHTRNKGGFFYHLEAVHAVRSNPQTYRAVISALDQTLLQGSPGAVANIPYAADYDRDAAVGYALRYALNRNEAYYDWSHRELGGDCTNFLSQVMFAGGWRYDEPLVENPVSRRDSSFWYYRPDDPSTSSWTWVNANMWASFAKKSGRVEKVKYLSDVGLGDIVQMGDSVERAKWHSMIVTGFDERGPLLSYHSNNNLNRPLWEVFREYRHESTMFFAWRVVKVS
ncbi:hypothetical protein Ait01nite_098010 [Actinoplanes italicus]|uniref:Putative amidase-like protein n=1 Tax=Actinoplanes italicus TaxID=113567 RepID=A0A2T0K3D6_9ACTN|nr:putative amidase-like protein [Actinoplanes italicus]GIE36756.1 hypothetical protein Ait01nite_098010 [Actinoplanes italicus]